jgi:hypothetical protein
MPRAAKPATPIKSSEIRALLEAKRDEINPLLPTVAPSVGIARVERDANNNIYTLRIGEKIVVSRTGAFMNFPWRSIGSDGTNNFACASLNDAIVKALPSDVRAEFQRKLEAG